MCRMLLNARDLESTRALACATLALVTTVLAPTRPALAELTVEQLRGAAVTDVGPYYQDLKDAIAAFGQDDYAAAFERLKSAKKLSPPLPPPEVMMARLYFDAQLEMPGNTLLEQSMRQDAEDPEPLVLLGERALAAGRLTEAAMMLGKAAPVVAQFRKNPNRRDDLEKRLNDASSLVAERFGDLAAAKKFLQALLKVDASNAAAMQRLGRVLFQLDEGREAYEQFKAAAAADPKAPPAEIAMAALFQNKTKGEEWLKHALERSGGDARTQLAIGNYRLRENRIDEARKHSDKALELDPTGLDTNLLAGMIARVEADYPKAEQHLGAAHLLSPADAGITNHLALVLIEMPDPDKQQRALQFAQLNAAGNPDALEPMTTLGWIYYRLDRRAEAERALSAAFKTATAKHGRVTSDMAYYLAVLAHESKRYPYAIKLLKDALDMDQPFAYRKPAQELLAELEKLNADEGEAAAASTTTPSTRTGGASGRR
mgnify:FL=1